MNTFTKTTKTKKNYIGAFAVLTALTLSAGAATVANADSKPATTDASVTSVDSGAVKATADAALKAADEKKTAEDKKAAEEKKAADDKKAGLTHLIEPGEYLELIVTNLGWSSVAEVAEWNGIGNPDLIFAGDTLNKPGHGEAKKAPVYVAPAYVAPEAQVWVDGSQNGGNAGWVAPAVQGAGNGGWVGGNGGGNGGGVNQGGGNGGVVAPPVAPPVVTPPVVPPVVVPPVTPPTTPPVVTPPTTPPTTPPVVVPPVGHVQTLETIAAARATLGGTPWVAVTGSCTEAGSAFGSSLDGNEGGIQHAGLVGGEFGKTTGATYVPGVGGGTLTVYRCS